MSCRFAGVIALIASLLVLPARSWAFSEDIFTNPGPHSTVHAELTMVLARAAGFPADQARFIAGVNQAVDVFPLLADLNLFPRPIKLTGTERNSGAVSEYFHWARRGPTDATGELKYPGKVDTCMFFDGSDDPCPGGANELDELGMWAVFGTGAPAVGTPEISIDGSPFAPVPGGSPAALGIYLHALADSYSHQVCMGEQAIRSHRSLQAFLSTSCNPFFWHLMQEFGRLPPNAGLPTTKQAGLAVFKALKFYREKHNLPGQPLWTNRQAKRFIKRFANRDQGRGRQAFALAAFAQLN